MTSLKYPVFSLPITIASNTNLTLNFSFLQSVGGSDSFTTTIPAGTYYNHLVAGDSESLANVLITYLNAAEALESSGGTWTDKSGLRDFEGITHLNREGHVNDVLTSIVFTSVFPGSLLGFTSNTVTFTKSGSNNYVISDYQRKYMWLPREFPMLDIDANENIMSMNRTKGGKKRYRHFKTLGYVNFNVEIIPAALVYASLGSVTSYINDVRNHLQAAGLTDITAGDPNISLETFVKNFLNDEDGFVLTPVFRHYGDSTDYVNYDLRQFSDDKFLQDISTGLKPTKGIINPLRYDINFRMEDYIA